MGGECSHHIAHNWVSKNSYEGSGDVEKRRKQTALQGNLLLPGANDVSGFNTINSCVNFQ